MTAAPPTLPGRGRRIRELVLGTPLGDRLTSNAFGVGRLVFALTVVFSHVFVVNQLPGEPLSYFSIGRVDSGRLAVYAFFAFSGFLIVQSAFRHHPLAFAWHRLLRIGPGFWVCLLVTVLLISPLAYLSRHGTLDGLFTGEAGGLSYLANNALFGIGQLGIADLFTDTPFGQASGISYMNGSLWTIVYEVLAYVGIALLTYLLARRFGAWLIPLVALLAASVELLAAVFPHAFGPFEQGRSYLLPVLGIIHPLELVRLSVPFLAGASIWVLRSRIPVSLVLSCSAGILGLLLSRTFLWGSLGVILVAYALISLAFLAPSGMHAFGRRVDISYGVYLYGYPLQQALASAGALSLGFWPFLVLSILAASGAGLASWLLVERRALRAKDYRPWRRTRMVPLQGSELRAPTA